MCSANLMECHSVVTPCARSSFIGMLCCCVLGSWSWSRHRENTTAEDLFTDAGPHPCDPAVRAETKPCSHIPSVIVV